MQVEQDYVDPKGLLDFTRVWRSDKSVFFSPADVALIDNTLPYEKEQCYLGSHEELDGAGQRYLKSYCYKYVRIPENSREIVIVRPNGNNLIYAYAGEGDVRAKADNKQILSRVSTGSDKGWIFNPLGLSPEHYDDHGRLVKKVFSGGRFVHYVYSTTETDPLIAPRPGLLLKMTDNYNRSLSFSYNALGYLNDMSDPSGEKISYKYSESSANCPAVNNGACHPLTSVTYQDGKTRRYHYNETGYLPTVLDANLRNMNFLTGITDENGVRLSHYKYDGLGRGISTGWGANHYKFHHGDTITVTNPAGFANSYNYRVILNARRLNSTSQPAGSGCAAANRLMTHDVNGNVKTSLNWNGVTTTFNYDLVRNLETSRTEAADTPAARTISTEWHPTLRLAKRIAEPKRITTYEYDADGNVTTTSVQATSDATGAAAFTATKVGAARVSTNAYNAQGMLWTVTGPRLDVPDVTTYLYDTSGNLESVTNAAGHRTTYSNYDVHGRARRITAANGVITDREFGLRGWLDAETVSAGGISKRTAYTYDNVGQVKKVELPDGGAMNYTYDNEHRLTGIADNRGNSVTYELDPMGNRKSESVKDPAGTLTRQVARTFDALNRVKTQTGVAQ